MQEISQEKQTFKQRYYVLSNKQLQFKQKNDHMKQLGQLNSKLFILEDTNKNQEIRSISKNKIVKKICKIRKLLSRPTRKINRLKINIIVIHKIVKLYQQTIRKNIQELQNEKERLFNQKVEISQLNNQIVKQLQIAQQAMIIFKSQKVIIKAYNKQTEKKSNDLELELYHFNNKQVSYHQNNLNKSIELMQIKMKQLTDQLSQKISFIQKYKLENQNNQDYIQELINIQKEGKNSTKQFVDYKQKLELQLISKDEQMKKVSQNMKRRELNCKKKINKKQITQREHMKIKKEKINKLQ